MAIYFGARPETDYTKVPNQWARDPKLSLKAKGLLTYLLSHQDGYRLSMEQVVAEVADGRASAYRAIRELIERGYIERRQRRAAGGKVGEVDYFVIDAPAATASQIPASRKPESGPDQAKQDVSAGQTAFQEPAYGSTAYGKSTTKKTKNLEDNSLQDQKITPPPTPSGPAAAAHAVAPTREEGEGIECSSNSEEQTLAATIRGIRPAWTMRKILDAIKSAADEGRPWPLIAAAFPICAADTATLSPGRFPHDGPWWAQAEAQSRPASREERIAVHCRVADTQPPCEHGEPGGSLPMPGDGWQPCFLCRQGTERARKAATPRSTGSLRAEQAMRAAEELQAQIDANDGKPPPFSALFGRVSAYSDSPGDRAVARGAELYAHYAALEAAETDRIHDAEIIEGDEAA